MKEQRMLNIVLTLAFLLVLTVGLGRAQGIGGGSASQPKAADAPEVTVDDAIPIQGRLTDASGNPLPDGDYSITFALYDDDDVVTGVLLCEDTETVQVANGLFSALMGNCTADEINGQQLWLGIDVEGDGEMTPRQKIAPVPYAWSLRPGADIRGEVNNASTLALYNSSASDDSKALYAISIGASGITYGVIGRSNSPDGYGGFFDNLGSGVAIKAAGSGVIQSTAKSYLWISGNGLQMGNSDDNTRFVYDGDGGYMVYGGIDWGINKGVVLPVIIPGQLYGQNVTVTGLDLYYTISADLTGIDRVSMRRQNGVGASDTILFDDTDLGCDIGAQCSKHWDLTQNNVLSDSQGIVYIAFGLGFSGENAYVHIGGVRLTLEHE